MKKLTLLLLLLCAVGCWAQIAQPPAIPNNGAPSTCSPDLFTYDNSNTNGNLYWGSTSGTCVPVSGSGVSPTFTNLYVSGNLYGGPGTAVSSTGVTTYLLAKNVLNGGVGQKQILTTSDTGIMPDVIAAVTSDHVTFTTTGGTSVTSGYTYSPSFGGWTPCTFDAGNAVTTGDYVVASTTIAGDCHDTGSTSPPSSGAWVGYVVTTGSGNQTIQYKPGVATGSRIINYQTAQAEQNGNGSDQVIYTYSMPAGTLSTGHCVVISAWLKHTTLSNSVTYKMNFGGTAIANNAGTSTSTIFWKFTECADSNTSVNSTGEQYTIGSGYPYQQLTVSDLSANTTTINLTFNVASGDKVTGYKFLVQLAP